ncbi:uncharacterized protein B0H64DRAFT_461694 [Chaetomium fimeti]|uniref:Uncharacterized protein n=1 Tax=Chaetomium fimeti TaxID=1854472 RepID=A0AAE0HH32_9PEZI|nr:hypothetical protein B0H64DRAFT_461694 [Chaetomium fimeti]
MFSQALLDEVIETLLLIILASDPLAASKPIVRRLLGAFVLLAFFLLAVLTIPTDLVLDPKATTPYDILGVKTTSSAGTITSVYNNLVRETKENVFISTLATPKLETYRVAHETLTNPLQRCVYHRDNKVPDWYGVPQLCWGELVVDKLHAAKTAIRGPVDAKESKGSSDSGQEPAPQLAKKTKPAKSTKESVPTESYRAGMSETKLTGVRQCLNWSKNTILAVPSKTKQYLDLVVRLVQLSILVVLPATVRRCFGRLKAILEFASDKTTKSLKGISLGKSLARLWDTVLSSTKEFLAWIKMLQFLINLPTRMREYFHWVKTALSHVTRKTTKALKRIWPVKFWARSWNALSTQTWHILSWLWRMASIAVAACMHLPLTDLDLWTTRPAPGFPCFGTSSSTSTPS